MSAIPEDLQDKLYERVNFTLVRDHNYGGFERAVNDFDELEATRTVAKELLTECATLTAELAAMKQERDEFERKGQQLASAYGNALINIHDLEAALASATAPVTEARTMNTRPCVSCGEQTVYSCVFDRMPLCGEIACREKHEEAAQCSGRPARIAAAPEREEKQ